MANTVTHYIEKNPKKKIKPLATGGGVGLLREKRSPALLGRIEEIGRLNDRRVTCLSRGSRRGLMRLAREYRQRGVRDMSARCRLDAEGL